MPFLMFLPLAVIAVVIIASKKAAEQKKRVEAMQRAEQMKRATSQAETPNSPVTPSVQVPPVRGAATMQRTAPAVPKQKPAPKVAASQQKHPQHDLCALRPDTPANPSEASEASHTGSVLSYEPNSILQGVIFSEILGKPKALR